jgi:ATP-dependent exoDNAse (exonuclease V) alpha subunit
MILSAVDRSTNISSPPELSDKINYTNTGNLAKSLIIKVGAPIILTVNHSKAKYREDGIVNSARGYVDSFQMESGNETEVKAIWIVFQNKDIGKKLRDESYQLRAYHTPNDPNAVPIEVFKVRFTLKSGDVNYQRTQFPAVLAYAVTAHKSQGDTLQEILIDFTGDEKTKTKPYICKGSFYTAITRATTGEDVYLQDFDPSYIQVNKKTEEVIEAMRKFRRYPFYKVYIEDKVFVDDNLELKIGYLNINDLTAEYHAEYINSDKNLAQRHPTSC